MRRTIPLLTVILALQIGLAALLVVRKDPLASTTPQTPLIDTSIQNVDHLLIEGHGPAGAGASATAAGASAGSAQAGGAATLASVELAKQNGKWVLPGYFDAPADKFKLNDVLDELAGLQRGLPIATTTSALKRFELADDNFERRLTLSEGRKVLSTVYFGSSAGVRQTDARTARDHAVYDVDLATYELPTQPSDWFDAGLLESDPDSLSELDVSANGQPSLQLQRQTHPAAPAPPVVAAAAATPPPAAAASTPVWVDPTLPAGQQVDGAHVDALARDIAELRVDAVLGLAAQPQWQQEHPLLTLVIHNSKHPGQADTWTLSAPQSAALATAAPAASGRSPAAARRGATPATAAAAASAPEYYILKNSAEPWYFKVSSTTGKQLLGDGTPAALLTATASPGKQPVHAKRRKRA